MAGFFIGGIAEKRRKEEKKKRRKETNQNIYRTTEQRLHNNVSLKTKAAPTNLSS